MVLKTQVLLFSSKSYSYSNSLHLNKEIQRNNIKPSIMTSKKSEILFYTYLIPSHFLKSREEKDFGFVLISNGKLHFHRRIPRWRIKCYIFKSYKFDWFSSEIHILQYMKIIYLYPISIRASLKYADVIELEAFQLNNTTYIRYRVPKSKMTWHLFWKIFIKSIWSSSK